MNSQGTQSHEMDGHLHMNKGIKLITISANSFVVPFAVMLMRIRSHHNFCQILFLITALITHLQLLMTCMYPMCTSFWENDPQCFNLIQIFSVFTRLLPENLSYAAAARASYFICLICTISFTTILSILLFYRPNSIFSSNSLPFLPTLSFFFLQILCYPMASLTVYFWFERDQNYSMYPAILCTVCFCFCFFGSRFYEHVLHCLPNFPKLYGVRWTLPQFFIKKILCVFCFVIVETIPHIPSKWAQILCVALVTAVFAYLAIDSFYFFDGLLVEYNVLCVFTFFSGTIFHLIAIFTLFASKRPGIYATLFIILSFPIYILSLMICRGQVSRFNRFFLKALKTSDFKKLDKMPVRLILSVIGRNLPLISNNFEILDHMVEIHPKSFDAIAMYAKFAALTFCHFDKLHDLLLSLKKLCNLSFDQQVLLIFIEILSLQDECTYNEQKIGEMCSIASTEYMSNLTLFWTEILLGRSERLISLSTSVDNKFQTAVCLFNLLGAGREKMNHSFEQFCSTATLKVSDPVFPDRYSFFNLLYQPKHQAIIFKGQEEALQERVFRYQPPLRSIHISAFLQKYQRKIQVLKLVIISLPIICAFIFSALGLVLVSLTYHNITPSWDLFYKFEMTGIDIATISSLSPFLLLSNANYINFTNVARQFLNNFLFNSRMLNASSDMLLTIQRLASSIPDVLKTINDYKQKSLVRDLLNVRINACLSSYNGTVVHQMDFIQYLNLISIRYGEQLRMTQQQLIGYFNISELNPLLITNTDLLIQSIVDFLMEFPFSSYDKLKDKFNKTSFIIEMSMLAIIVVFIIIAVILILCLFKAFDQLFEPLFLLPKVSLSELIDKFSSRPLNEQISESQEKHKISNQITYNLKQLAYERPSQSYRTKTEAKIIYFIIIIIFIIIVRLIFCPVISIIKNDFHEVFRGMQSATNGYIVEITLLKILRDLAELTNRFVLNIVIPPNREEELFDRLLNNSLNLQKDLILLSFRGSSFPKIIDKSFFFQSPNNGSTRLANFSYVDKISYLYAEIFQFLHMYEQGEIQQSLVQNLFDLTFSAISQQIPVLSNDIYANAYKLSNWMIDKCIMLICFMFFIAFILYIIIRFSPTFTIRDADFAQPIFASVPLRSIHRFHQYLGAAENDERTRDEDPKLAMTIFDTDLTFQTVLDPLIMINQNGRIVSMSASAYKLFNIETLPTDSLSEFLQMFSVEDIEITMPNVKAVTFTFHLKDNSRGINKNNNGNTNNDINGENDRNNNNEEVIDDDDIIDEESLSIGQSILFVNLFPTRKFMYKSDNEKDGKAGFKTTTNININSGNNAHDDEDSSEETYNNSVSKKSKLRSFNDEKDSEKNEVCYGCLITDITKLSALIAQLTYEANRVSLLTVQLGCNPALSTFLNMAPFYPTMMPKLAIASFLIPSASENLDVVLLTQQAIRDALNQNPSLTFFGRTTQMFRVVSGLSEKMMMTTTESCKILILFAQRLMSNIEQVQQHLKMQIFDIRCGIHLSGPYIGDIISEMPPVFELFGAPMMISQQIAASAVPKHISISRDVLEAVFDQGFNISFDKEITTVYGDEISIHNVES